MLTFELEDGDELHVHFDSAGLQLLRAVLAAAERAHSHEHLMTPSWGGAELSEEKLGEDAELLNKVTVHFWDGT